MMICRKFLCLFRGLKTIHKNIKANFLKHKETLDFKKHLRKPKANFIQKKELQVLPFNIAIELKEMPLP